MSASAFSLVVLTFFGPPSPVAPVKAGHEAPTNLKKATSLVGRSPKFVALHFLLSTLSLSDLPRTVCSRQWGFALHSAVKQFGT